MSSLPAAVVFDWDNTLVDSWLVIHDALNETFAAMGLPAWTIAETRERVRHSLRDSFPKLFGDRWDAARLHYLAAFEAIHLERLRPLPGAGALLARLRTAGIPMSLVSNKTGRLLRKEVAALDWQSHFHAIVGAGDAESDKPHRAPVDLALAGSGVEPGDTVWFVGDTAVDLECAVNAGCVPVLLLAGAEMDETGLAACPPRHRFTDFSALADAILPSAPCIGACG